MRVRIETDEDIAAVHALNASAFPSPAEADLVVDTRYQRSGIGKALVAHTQRQLGPRCKIRLIAAPDAAEYYPRIGFTRNSQCWELARDREIG